MIMCPVHTFTFDKSRHTVSTMTLFTAFTLLAVYILVGPWLDWLKSTIWVAFWHPLMLRAKDELLVLRVRYLVWRLSYSMRPVTLRGMPELMVAFACRSSGLLAEDYEFIDCDLADPAQFERVMRMAILRERGEPGPDVEELKVRPRRVLITLIELARMKAFKINVNAAEDLLHVLDGSCCGWTGLARTLDDTLDRPRIGWAGLVYALDGERKHLFRRKEYYARLLLIIVKGLFVRGRQLYYPPLRAQVRTFFMTRAERSLMVHTLMRPEQFPRPHTFEQACAAFTVDSNYDGEMDDVHDRVNDIVEALEGGGRLAEDSLLHCVVERNLERIKKRLWHPDGRLARRAIESAF